MVHPCLVPLEQEPSHLEIPSYHHLTARGYFLAREQSSRPLQNRFLWKEMGASLCQRTLVWKGCVSWDLHDELQRGMGRKTLVCILIA